MDVLPIDGPLRERVITALGQATLFSSLQPEQLGQVAARAELRKFEPGEYLVQEGEPSDTYLLILSGEVSVVVGGIEIATLRTPDGIGELGILLDQPRAASASAIGAVLAIAFDAASFKVMYERVPGFGLVITRNLAQRLSDAPRRLPLPTYNPGSAPEQHIVDLIPPPLRKMHSVTALAEDEGVVTVGFVQDPTGSAVHALRRALPSSRFAPVRIKQEVFDAIEEGRPLPGAPAPVEAGASALTATNPAEAMLPPAAPVPAAQAANRAPAQLSSPQLDAMLRTMVQNRASDIHFSGSQATRWRIDGDIGMFPDNRVWGEEDVYQLFRPIMAPEDIEIFEEENDIDFAYAIEGLARFRVNVFRDQGGIGAVLRQIPADILTMEQLGLPPVIPKMCEQPKGLILVTGPTGSGKSTTLAAMIDYINKSRKAHIITLEDPVEFVHQSRGCLVHQREVGKDTKSFARALKAALREDPDIVLVGELRDLETVSLALETANTGHLVFGTLHTATAISTVDRIIDLFPHEQQSQVRTVMSESLKGVIAQTLCKRKGGGRVAALEILVCNYAVSNLIREGKTIQINSIMATQKQQGNQMLGEELAKLVKDGTIEYEEAYAKALDKADIAKRCGKPNNAT